MWINMDKMGGTRGIMMNEELETENIGVHEK